MGQQRMFFRACSVEDFDLRRSRAAVLVETLVSDDAGVGRSAPLYPSGTGCERVHTLSRSPGGCSIGKVGFRRDKRAARLEQRRMFFRACSVESFDLRRSRGAVLVETLVSDDAGVGRSSPGAVRSEVLVSGGTGGRRIPSAAVRSQLRLSRKCPWRSFGNGSG